MYPFANCSSKNESSSLVSSSVKLYVLNDLGSNPSFISILWSQGFEVGNRSAASLSKTLIKLWNCGGTISSTALSCLGFSCCRARFWEAVIFVLIHSGSCSNSSPFMYLRRRSNSSSWFSCSTFSFFFFFWIFRISWFFVLQETCPVSQSIMG